MKIKKLKKLKKYYSENGPTKLSWPISAKSNKNFFLFKKKKKLQWPMSAKSDTQLPGFMYNQIRIFMDRL